VTPGAPCGSHRTHVRLFQRDAFPSIARPLFFEGLPPPRGRARQIGLEGEFACELLGEWSAERVAESCADLIGVASVGLIEIADVDRGGVGCSAESDVGPFRADGRPGISPPLDALQR
jgi:hypothetical protein